MRALIGIVSVLLVFAISLILAVVFIPDLVWAIGIAVIVGVVINCKAVLPYCTINVPANKAWIISNPAKTESAARLETFSGYRKIRAQTEFQAGFHWKYFWEVPEDKGEIDMTRQIPVENDPEEPYTLLTGKTITIKWRIFCEPLPGSVVNYIRTKPEDIQRRVKDRVEGHLQGYIGTLTDVGFGEPQILAIKAMFKEAFGGPEKIDDEERELGIWTGTPEIIDIDQPKDVQAAKNFETEMETNIRVASKMVKDSKNGMKFETAMKMVLLAKGKAKIDYIELAGVFPSAQKNDPNKKGGKNAGTI